MADTTEGDTVQVQHLGVLLPALVALIAGLATHSFIIGVNVNDWWKGRSVTPVDHIVTSLGISRICNHCAITLYLFLKIIFLSNMHLPLVVSLIYGFFAYANVWLTTLLSIVYCLKICNLHTRLFLYLRRMILHRTVYFIVASLLFSILNCLMYLFSITKITDGETYNITLVNLSQDCLDINSLYYFTIGAFIPLLFCSISSVLLFSSLYHHTTRMKMSSNLSINLETYYSAMKFVSFTFMYITMNFTGYFSSALYYYFYCVNFAWFHIILGLLPALHSSYLIYKTAKLRNQMSKVLHNITDFLFFRKDTVARENIEMVAQ